MNYKKYLYISRRWSIYSNSTLAGKESHEWLKQNKRVKDECNKRTWQTRTENQIVDKKQVKDWFTEYNTLSESLFKAFQSQIFNTQALLVRLTLITCLIVLWRWVQLPHSLLKTVLVLFLSKIVNINNIPLHSGKLIILLQKNHLKTKQTNLAIFYFCRS